MATTSSSSRAPRGGGRPSHHPHPHPHPHHHASPSSSHSHSHRSFHVHSPQQAWAALERHCRHDLQALTLRQLLRDDDRVSALVTVHATESNAPESMTIDRGNSTTNVNSNGKESRSIILDLSRQRMTMDTLNLLFRYASSRDLKRRINFVAWGGQNDPRNPLVPSRIRSKQQQTQQQQPQQGKSPPPPTNARHEGPHHHRPTTTTTFLEMESEDHDHGNHGNSHHVSPSSSSSSSSSMHMALRVPPHKAYEMLDRHGHNVLPDLHREWDRLERTSDCYRRGQLRGATGAMIRSILVIGRGVPVAALQFVHDALAKDERASLASRFGLAPPSESAASRIRRNLAGAAAAVGGSAMAAAVLSPGMATAPFGSTASSAGSASTNLQGVAAVPSDRRFLRVLSSIDPVAVAEATADLDPASTLVISIALCGDEETGLATKAIKGWLLRALAHAPNNHHHQHNSSTAGGQYPQPQHNRKSSDYVLKHHMVLVTGNDHIATVINKPESVYVIPEHSRAEPFTSFTSAGLLPLSIVFGWTIVREFLDGAHDMDHHFVSAHMRHNLPVLLALCDVWNDAFLGASSRVVTPYSRSFASFPAMVTALEAQACSRPLPDRDELPSSCPASLVVDGGAGSAYDRVLYQSQHVVHTELITSFDTQLAFNSQQVVGTSGFSEALAFQDAHMCSLFAHADELALGHRDLNDLSSTASMGATSALPDDGGEGSDGNRPSTLLFTGRVDAFVCGQLVALSEHRAIVKAHLLGFDPFVRRCGASMRLHRADQLKATLHTMFQGGGGDDADPEDDEMAADPSLNLATRTLLRHYANHSLLFKQNSVREA